MTLQSRQTLEDLRQSAQAAWLWDGMRGRLVWANKAGIAAFDGQSVFDLIDRVFDPTEPGIAKIAELTQLLKRDEQQIVALEFPSTGRTDAFACRCWLHSLADGRPGLIVVENAGAAVKFADEKLFAQMPVAAILIARDGTLSQPNAMAQIMFDASTKTDLSSLLGNAQKAHALLGRLETTNLLSSIESFNGYYGAREARLTLQRLADAEGPFAILLLEDITERRQLEKSLGDIQALAPRSQVPDAQAFAAVAQSLKEAIGPEPKAAAAKAKVPKPYDPSYAAKVPKTIRDGLELGGKAVLIVQNNVPVFASSKAVSLLGYPDAMSVLQDEPLWQNLASGQLISARGGVFPAAITTARIAWVNGPAQQYVFSPLEADAPHKVDADSAPLIVVEPKPSPKLAVVPHGEAPTADTTANDNHAAAEELKNILDIASDGLITLDGEGRILSFSAGAEAIFGYRIAEVMEKPLADFMAPESRKILRDYLAGFDGPGLATVFNDGREVAAIVKQGGNVPLFMTIGRLQSARSKAVFCAVVRDITSWKRTEKELREAKETAEAASRQKSEFLARISHELRTPLNAIMGFSDVMRLGQFGDIKNEKYRGYVNDIHASGGHLLSLINDLLDLSKIEAGKMELNFTAVSVTDIAEHAIKLLQEQSTRGRVLVRKSFPDKLPRVVADLRALRQVMLNLLSNAIKFTDPGGQVIISASVTKSGELVLKLKDTGIGMNAAQMKDALEPFKRVETRGRETQGTGLGLPLTKALVEANRAKFNVTSESGQGTLVEIIFPTTRVLAE